LDENTRGREYLAKELISYEVPSDEELRKADKIIEADLDIVNVVMAAEVEKGVTIPRREGRGGSQNSARICSSRSFFPSSLRGGI
jgi:hypothetical protein